MRPDEEFTSLQIMKKALLDAHKSMYRVYKSPKEYVTVEAATALEALRESAVKNPHKIVRQIRFKERLMGMDRLAEGEDDVVQTGHVKMEAPMAITGHQENVPAGQEMPREVVKEAHELTQADVRPPGQPAAAKPQAEAQEAEESLGDEAEEIPEESVSAAQDDVEEAQLMDDEHDAVENTEQADEDQLSEDDIAKLLNSGDGE